jgi:glycosyltransferase involved in cell wall biosynthesis
MSKYKPIVSVAMPVYNGEDFIEDAVRCVLNQTYPHLELVISDNASTDNTERICRQFTKEDKRVKYVRNQTNIGAANNYNQAFWLTTGSYFRWNNADDLCSPKLHELCLAVLMKNPDTVLSYGKTTLIDNQGKFIKDYDDNLNLRQEKAFDRFKAFFKQVGLTNVIYGLMRRSAVEKTALMGNGTYFASDTNFMAEMTLHGKFYELSEHLFSRRMHESASSWDRKNNKVQFEFWQGRNAEFTLPRWKKQYAFLKAIQKAPLKKTQKAKLHALILQRMIWSRKELLYELMYDLKRLK